MYGTLVTVAEAELIGDIVVPVALLDFVELRGVLLTELLAAVVPGMVAEGEDDVIEDEDDDEADGVDDRNVEVAVPADITVIVMVVVCAATS